MRTACHTYLKAAPPTPQPSTPNPPPLDLSSARMHPPLAIPHEVHRLFSDFDWGGDIDIWLTCTTEEAAFRACDRVGDAAEIIAFEGEVSTPETTAALLDRARMAYRALGIGEGAISFSIRTWRPPYTGMPDIVIMGFPKALDIAAFSDPAWTVEHITQFLRLIAYVVATDPSTEVRADPIIGKHVAATLTMLLAHARRPR